MNDQDIHVTEHGQLGYNCTSQPYWLIRSVFVQEKEKPCPDLIMEYPNENTET